MLYFQAKADKEGKIPLSFTYRVQRKEVIGSRRGSAVTKEDAALFLKPDAKVPVGGKPATLLQGKPIPADRKDLARLLYDVVNEHMQYSKKGTGWGQGDAVWACDSRYGNCTDFHSLFISLARTNKMPAKFEIGFAVPEKGKAEAGKGVIGGYHCWAEVSPDGKTWIPVDISQANQVKDTNPKMVEYLFGNLTEDRIVFSVGRDLTLVPPQSGPPLNFFIYPYVEVEGQPYPAGKIRNQFSYQDVG
jgi:transglutaminase-like putative cysteine protease